MLTLPNRLESLMRRIEAGEAVTSADVDRIAALQVLDVAMLGRRAVEQACAEQEKQLSYIEALK